METSNDNNSDEEDSIMNVENNEVSPSASLQEDNDRLKTSNDNNSDEEDSIMNVENNEVSPSASSQTTMTDRKLQITKIVMKEIPS